MYASITPSRPAINPLVGLLVLLSLLLAALPTQQIAPFVQRPISAAAQDSHILPARVGPSDWQQVRPQIEQQQLSIVAAGVNSYTARNSALGWQLDFGQSGLDLRPQADADWQWGLQLRAYGRDGALLPVEHAQLSSNGQTVSYQWDANLQELFHNRSDGLKQDFILQQRPNGSGPLRLELATPGNLSGTLSGAGVAYHNAAQQQILSYTGLYVYDAKGQTIPAWFSAQGQTVSIHVDDTQAVYPLMIDPLVFAQDALLHASNTDVADQFGYVLAVSGDTMVVGAPYEDSAATGVNGNQASNSASDAGAAYVFTRTAGVWSQQAYLKASNAGAGDNFGQTVAISGDTIVVGAAQESSNATGVNGNQANNSATYAGAAYVFTRTAGVWSQQAYLKASNTDTNDYFGEAVAIAGDTIVVGAIQESSNATGVNGDQADDSAAYAGAAYVFTRTAGAWSQQAYLKASNTGAGDYFGQAVAISGDTIVVSAVYEDSAATGVNGDQIDNTASNSGATYVFTRTAGAWSQQAYLKASNTGAADTFGRSLAIDGDTIVVGADWEDSAATGANGDQASNDVTNSGAAYVFTRTAGVWSQQAYLKASNTDVNSYFGEAVAISGDRIVIGAYSEGGGAYVFTRTAAAWSLQAYLIAAHSGPVITIGKSVGIADDTIVSGAPFAQAIYTFTPAPYLVLSGNGQAIGNGDTSPSLADRTDFGTLTLGQSSTSTFTISNNGAIDLILNSLSLSGLGMEDFSLSGLSTPRTVAVGASVTFQVQFRPTVTQNRQAALTLSSNDRNNNPFIFVMQGSGKNQAPIAKVGAEQTVTEGDTVTLNGSASSDPDGHTPLSYSWTQQDGPSVILSNPTSATPSFVAPFTSHALSFYLTVTDTYGAVSPSSAVVWVNVNTIPIAGLSASNNSPTALGLPTSFIGAVTDDSGVTFEWEFGDGEAGSGANLTHTYAFPGSYNAVLTAHNGDRSTRITSVVTITSELPLARAGADQTVALGALVTLDGSASSAPDGEDLSSYSWTQTAGPSVTLKDPFIPTPTFSAPATSARLSFSLIVTDRFGVESVADTVVITVGSAQATKAKIFLPLVMGAHASAKP